MCLPKSCSRKDPVVRPKRISITRKKRCRQFGKVNSVLFVVYRVMRGFFVAVWFYYLPVLFIVVSNIAPVFLYWTRIDGCDKFVSQDCVGASGVSSDCLTLCRAFAPEYESIK